MIVLDIACYTLIVVVLIQVFFFIHIFGKFVVHKPQSPNTQNKPPVSVIICAKNEAKNLKAFLPSILNQNYPNFQIILINDASKDETLEVMDAFAQTNSNIKIVNVKPVEMFWGNKKYPLTLGIKAAKYNTLLFTDADCKPVSQHWISEMVSHFNKKKSIVLGYGAYAKVKGSLLNKLIRFETLFAAVSYFSMAKIGMPYMGVGRNLAYTKSQFFNVNGFMGHMNVRSGDDDLFVNEAATNTNVALSVSKDSFTISTPKKTFKSWFRQKRRHISTAKHYKTNHKIVLALVYSTNFMFWSLSLLLLCFWYAPVLTLSLILTRLCVYYSICGIAAKRFNEKDLIVLLPFLEIILITVQLAIFITNNISKPRYWK